MIGRGILDTKEDLLFYESMSELSSISELALNTPNTSDKYPNPIFLWSFEQLEKFQPETKIPLLLSQFMLAEHL